MSLKDSIISDGGEALLEIEQLLADCTEVQNSCPGFLRYLVDPTIDPLREDAEVLIEYVEELIDRLGDAELIREVALDWQTWGDDMGGHATSISPTGTNLPSLDSWDDNGDVYSTVAGQQHAAVGTALPEIAYAIHDQLEDMAQHLENYWREAFEFIGQLVGGVVGVIGSIAGLIAACLATGLTAGLLALGIVAAVSALIASITALVTLPGKWDDVMAELDGITVDALGELQRMLNDPIGNHANLDSGTWPPHIAIN
ncbi:hypothetical protein ACPYO6_14215 [Georgenia sp. Z1344]|uniref:hypothetical protein n=1 Tax=Georgenia sp. Z1344 TaxID=3416706 RepID=UPI003CEDF5BA